jgi:FkbM family methyltransferase
MRWGKLAEAIERRVLRMEQWQSARRGAPIPCVHEGTRLYLNAEPSARYHLENTAPKIQRLVDVLVSAPGVVFDVGANCGWYSALVSRRFPDAKIHAFEPAPDLQHVLRMNVGGNVTVVAQAVGDHAGTAALHINPDSQQTNSTLVDAVRPFAKRGRITKVDVPLTTLDDYCAANRIDKVDVLKVDVQGAEGSVFRGARTLLPRVQTVVVESTWLDLESISGILPFAQKVGFEHLQVVNLVLSGADVALSRTPLRELDGGLPRIAIAGLEQVATWL